MEQSDKDALKVQALNQRIGELVASYEDGMAELRAEATYQLESMQNHIIKLQSELAEAKGEVSEETPAEVEG